MKGPRRTRTGCTSITKRGRGFKRRFDHRPVPGRASADAERARTGVPAGTVRGRGPAPAQTWGRRERAAGR